MTILNNRTSQQQMSTDRMTGGWRRTAVALALGVALNTGGGGAFAQQPAAQSKPQLTTITPNFKDADLALVVQAVQSITGKTFIIDPRVRATVTILSSTPLSPAAFYEAFLSVLQVHDFVAVPSGNVVKIIPAANSRFMPADDLPDKVSATSDEIVTQVIAVKNVSVNQLVPPLRPLLPQGAHFVPIAGTNSIIISDRASNVNRIMRIIQRVDQAGDDEVDVIKLENASSADIVKVINTLYSGAAAQQEQAAGIAAKIVADERTNSILLSGDKTQRIRLRTLIAHLDTPLEGGGDTEVRYLQYADAEAIATKLKEQIQGIVSATPGAAANAPGGAANIDRSIGIWADKQTNAIVITAPPKVKRQVMAIIDRLDIRRAQIHVEAILVDMSLKKAAELGINWAVGSTSSSGTVPIGTFNQTVGNSSIGSIAAAIQNPATLLQTGLPTGLTLGAGSFPDSGTNFAILLRALRGDSSTNILQTPSVITLDNEEAEIKVAQEVPFVTGQFTGTSGNNNGSVNPFQTIQREEVGTILKITPKINNTDSVMLKISQESSTLAQGTQGAVDLITNKRTITTTVMVEDGGVIVLGGLITDSATEGENRVPVLGAIPLIGEFFKTRNGSKEKTNLMVFIRPTILRDGISTAVETNAKYNVLRDQQLQRRNGKVTLLPGERQPLLPPIEELSKYADPTAGARKPAPGTDESTLKTAPLPPQPAPQPTEPVVVPPGATPRPQNIPPAPNQ
ncbi:MAG TPA: type II secretion system secretin GspD [Steroidobacteraceae bacterium]|jgi:general secretion pathway protein D